jgi:hypothetical protein
VDCSGPRLASPTTIVTLMRGEMLGHTLGIRRTSGLPRAFWIAMHPPANLPETFWGDNVLNHFDFFRVIAL